MIHQLVMEKRREWVASRQEGGSARVAESLAPLLEEQAQRLIAPLTSRLDSIHAAIEGGARETAARAAAPEAQNTTTLTSLRVGLSKDAEESLLRRIRAPLSTDALPPRQDLADFWEAAEGGITSLGPDVALEFLDAQHLRVIAPVILGDAVWDLYKRQNVTTWRALRAQVDSLWG